MNTKKSLKNKKSGNAFTWFCIILITFTGLQMGNYWETALIVCGLLFIMYVIPIILNSSITKEVDNIYNQGKKQTKK